MSKYFRSIYIFLLLFGLSISFVEAQTTFASEEELKKQAAKLFEEEAYEKAAPLYSQLVSNYLKDPNYNYRLGVCLLYTNADKEKAIPYLELAVNKQDVEKEAHYYLGLAYHLNYRFDEAILQYQAYTRIAQAKNIERLQVQRQMEMCVNGKKLLQNLSDLQVTEKKEMNKEDFFRSYDISSIGGKLLVKPEEKEFKTALDKKKKEQSIIYMAKDKSQLYFSSYGMEGVAGKDIYVTKKLPSGEWAKPQLVGGFVNTKYDEDFPFIHPNGKALYFSSKGHNSMGGYDIFKSVYNELTQSWGPPQNMDFPINTPDDDILYVTDSTEKEAYFSSSRGSVSGKIAVYHINVDRKPLDVVIIKGNVLKNRNNQDLDVKITVKDLATNNILGMYNSSGENGAYSLELPNGGSFSFTVEAPGFPTQSDVVIVPVQYKYNPMKQEISYDLVTSRLKITNSFGGTNEDENYLLALNYIKNKSKMEVSLVDLSPVDSSKSDISADSTTTAGKSEVVAADKKLSNEDIIKIAYEDAKDVDAEAKELQEQADIALNLANQKNELAKTRSGEATAYMAEAKNATDIAKKEEFFDKSDAASTEAKKLNQETVIAYNLAKKIEASAFKKQEEANVSQQYAKELEAAVQQGSTPEALAKVEVQEKKLEELSKANEGVSSISNNLKIESDSKQRELNKAVQTSSDIKQEMADNETIISNLKLDIEKTKNEELKQGIDNQIAELSQENTFKKTELAKNEVKVAKLQKEYEVVSNEAAMVNEVITQSKTESSETASADVAAIDKNKLEQQVNSIAGVTPATTPPEAIPVVATATTPVTNIPDNTIPVSTKPETTPVLASSTTATATPPPTLVDTPTEETDLETMAPVVSTTTTTVTSVPEKTVPVSEKPVTVPVVAVATDPVVNTTDNTKSQDPDNPYLALAPEKTTNEVLVDIDKKNEPDLVAAEKIENAADREKAKAVVLQKWAKEIESNRLTLQQEYDTTTNYTEKAILFDKMNELTVSSNKKQAMANASLAMADSIQQQKQMLATAVNATTTTVTTTTAVNDPSGATTTVTTTDIPAVVTTNTVAPATTGNTAANPNTVASNTTAPDTNTTTTVTVNALATNTASGNTSTTDSDKPTTTAGNNTTATTTATPPVSAVKPIDEKLEKINKANEADMAVVEAIENKKDREKARAAALKMWSEEVEEHTTVLEKNYKNTTDTAEKNLLAVQIAAAKKSAPVKPVSETTSKPSDEVTSDKSEQKPMVIGTSKVMLLPDEAFERRASPVYTAQKPIPVNDKLQLPEGIIYKVQIGAFRNPISQNLFVGMSPITGERTPQGFIRYTAGIFKNRSTAESIKNEIKNLGYKDAFVVAFKDGKRIPMKEANAISGDRSGQEGTPIVANTATPLTVKELQSKYTDIVPARNAATPTPTPTPVAEERKDITPTENVTTVGGLFYTIQVGVFTQAVQPSKLYNIQPIYTETAPNGNLRYNVGIYNNLGRALEAKTMAIDIGIKDAFITAYYNGKRISMTEAKQYEYEGGASVFSTAPNVNVLPYFGKEKKTSVSQNTPISTPVNTATTPPINSEQPAQATEPTVVTPKKAPLTVKELQNLYTDILKPSDANSQIRASTFATDVVFKVQVGAFRNEVPLDIVNKFLKISRYGVENYVDINGMTIYTAGDYKTYEEANKVKQELAAGDFQDAFVVAYRKGKKITMDEAKQ